jgi:hypothetical protein
MRRLNLPFTSLTKKSSDSGAPGCCGSALGGEWSPVVGTECDGGGLPNGPGCDGGGSPVECDGGGLPAGSGCDGGGLPAGSGCDGGGPSVDTGCDGGSPAGPGCDGDPGCDPADNVCLEVAVSDSDDADAVLSELIVFHSVTDSSVRYPAFVDD